MNFIFALFLLLLLSSSANAQGCGQGNPNCVAPTAPPGDNSTRIANTAWVVANGGGGGGGTIIIGTTPITGGTSEGILFNNGGIVANTAAGASGAFLIGQGGTTPPAFTFLSGDCTAINTGVITCSKTGGVAFSNLATLASVATSNVLGNFSGGSAAATAQSVPSCANDGGHALTNNAGSGFNCTVVSGSSVSLVIGTTPIASGTSLGLLYNNAGILGNTAAPTTGQLYVGQASGPALWQTPSGDCTLAANGAITCPKTSGVAFGNLATLGTIAASNVLGNFTGGAANATAQAVPSCASDGTHALTNNLAGGFNCTTVAGGGSSIGPTQQKFTSGSGTYTTPANTVWIEIYMGGGGGGGGEGGGSGNTGSTGGATTFGTSLLSAGGGTGGTGCNACAVQVTAGAGGAASLGSGPLGVATVGNAGTPNDFNAVNTGGGGAASCLGGGTASTVVTGSAGASAAANTAAGGAGGVANTSGGSGAGGGSGGCVHAFILSPSATYSYAVGGGGAGGTGGAGANGGAGGSGLIVVLEHYNH